MHIISNSLCIPAGIYGSVLLPAATDGHSLQPITEPLPLRNILPLSLNGIRGLMPCPRSWCGVTTTATAGGGMERWRAGLMWEVSAHLSFLTFNPQRPTAGFSTVGLMPANPLHLHVCTRLLMWLTLPFPAQATWQPGSRGPDRT